MSKDDYLNTNAHLETKVAMLERALAASQARESKLRDALMRSASVCFDEPSHFKMLRDPSFFVNVALAIPKDDSALRELIAAEREACAKVCEDMPLGDIWASPGQCAEAIRARGIKP